MKIIQPKILVALAIFTAIFVLKPGEAFAKWQPPPSLECVVPAGEGGGSDQMIRFIAREIEKRKLSPQKITVVNKPGGSGIEGYMYLKNKKGSNDTLLISLTSIFTLPVAMGAQFRWNELTPIARMALDEFVLWVHADTPYHTLEDYIKVLKSKEPGAFKMGGTGAAQEDQLITIMLERAAGVKFTYVPMGGGGSVAQALKDKKIDSTVNNPAEAAGFWKEGKVRPLAIFDSKRLTLPDWLKIPTMKEKGYDVEYLMMRGIFGPPGMDKEAAAYYLNILQKVYNGEEFKAYLRKNSMIPAWVTGAEFVKWLEDEDVVHRNLLNNLGLK